MSIMTFGHRSFVTDRLGLKEKIEKAEKEIQMRNYRGLTKDKDEKWIYGWYFEIWAKAYILWGTTNDVPNMTEVIPETTGQQIGLKDKNGKDLGWWEDDLLRKGSDHPNAPIGRIMFDTQKAQWVIVSRSGGEFCGLLQAHLNDWKKIGNIHENPELSEQ